MPTTLVSRTIDGRVFLPYEEIRKDPGIAYGPLHETTSPEAIRTSIRRAVRAAVREFQKLFPECAVIPHAISMLGNLPLSIVTRVLNEE